jgi:DNA ligase-1
MTKTFQPMLAATVKPEDVSKLRFPLLVSPKLDGIRAVVRGGVLLSRKLKPIPSRLLQQQFGQPAFEGLDGEFITGDPAAPNAFLRTQSVVMSHMAPMEEIQHTLFHIFDKVEPSLPFFDRNQQAFLMCQMFKEQGLRWVPHQEVADHGALIELEKDYLSVGFEGAMLRSPDGPYKYGRSTLNEGWLIKLKRFADAEAEITGFDEKMHNGNVLVADERGYAKRTTHQANLVPAGTLGALRVVGRGGDYDGVVFNIGTGFDDALRANIWDNRAKWLGKLVKFKYFATGSKDSPRFPVYLGLRED